MNPAEINKRIAIACGWKPCEHPQFIGYWIDPKNADYAEAEFPNCHGDLNAMHEAENALKDEQKFPYMQEIYNLTDAPAALVCGWYLTHATAAQRAEAFLRTIGQWEDEK